MTDIVKTNEEVRAAVLPFERRELSNGETRKPRKACVKIHKKEKGGENMNRVKAEAIVARLLRNAEGVRFGAVTVTAKLHEGRLVGVVYSITECTKEAGESKND